MQDNNHKPKLTNNFQSKVNGQVSKPSYLITTNPDRFLQNSNRKTAMTVRDREEINPEMAEVVQKILLKRKKEKKNVNNNNNSMIKSRKVDSMKKYFDDIYNKKHVLNKEKYNKLNKTLLFDSLHDRINSENSHINYFDYINKAPNNNNSNKNQSIKKYKLNISCNNYSRNSRNATKIFGSLKTNRNDYSSNTVMNKYSKKFSNKKFGKDIYNDNEFGYNNKLSNSMNLDEYEEYGPKNIKKIKIIRNNQYILNLNSITIDVDQINKDKNLMEINCSALEDKLINSKLIGNKTKKSQKKIILQQIDNNNDGISLKNISKETPSTKNFIQSDNNMKNKILNIEKKNISNNPKLKNKQKEINRKNKNLKKTLNHSLEHRNKYNLNRPMNDNQFNMTMSNGFYPGNLTNMNKNNNSSVNNNGNKKLKLNSNKASQKEILKKNILNPSIKNDNKLKVNKEINNKKFNKNNISTNKNINNKKALNVQIHSVKIKPSPTHSKNGSNISTERTINNKKSAKLVTNNISNFSNYNNYAQNRSLSKDYFQTEHNINRSNKRNLGYNEGICMSVSNKNSLIKANFKFKNNEKEKEKNIKIDKSLDKKMMNIPNLNSKNEFVNTGLHRANSNSIKKEYPNMAKFLYGRKLNTEVFDEEEVKSSKIRQTKAVNRIESICKKGYSGPGVKKTNQDNFFIYNNFNNNSNYVYLGVCDGHGLFGQDISTYLVNNLPQNMNNNVINKGIKNLSTEKISTLSDIFQETFIQTNMSLNEDERIDSSFSGSTCVSLLFTPTRIFCINVGDSRCIIGKYNGHEWSSKCLSRDHKPSEPDEMNRIIKSGGRVESYRDNFGNFVGPERVWNKGGEGPGLAMSRSFGDEIAHKVGVVVDPEIMEYFFLKEDKFIILGSDGIWEFISNDEVVEIVKDYYLQNNIEGAIEYLYNESSKRWIMEEEVIDDITIIIIFLK